MQAWTFVLDFFLGLAILILFSPLGRLLGQYRSDYQPLGSLFQSENSLGFNAVVRICIAPIGIVVASIILYSVHWDKAVKHIWIASIFYFLLQMVELTLRGRWKLVNKSKYFVFHLISIALSFYIYNSLIVKGLPHLLPDEANLRTDLWLLIAAFLYGIFRMLPENEYRALSRKRKYINSRAKFLKKRYSNSLKPYSPLLRDILVSIMIYEDYNRPRTIRFLEKLVKSKTQGIMQVRGAKTDEESITLAAELVQENFESVMSTEGKSPERLSAIYTLFQDYNPGDYSYSTEVMTILQMLRDVSPITPATHTLKNYSPL